MPSDKWALWRWRLLRALSPSAWKGKLDYWRANRIEWPPVRVDAARIKYDSGKADNDRLCLFSSFSFGGTVGDYVWRYLEALRRERFDLVFLSTSPLNPEDTNRLSGLCRLVVEKDNDCPDFSAWKIGLHLTDNAKGYESALLANDSVFGPLRDLGPIIADMQERRADFWGMTDSPIRYRHVQSYFVWANRKAIDSPAWKSYWENIRACRHRLLVCLRYEVGLSQMLQSAGFTMDSFVSCEGVKKECGDGAFGFSDDVTVSHWRALIEKYGFPFVKRRLFKAELWDILSNLRREEYRELLASFSQWRETITANSDYPLWMIEEEIKRMPGSIDFSVKGNT